MATRSSETPPSPSAGSGGPPPPSEAVGGFVVGSESPPPQPADAMTPAAAAATAHPITLVRMSTGPKLPRAAYLFSITTWPEPLTLAFGGLSVIVTTNSPSTGPPSELTAFALPVNPAASS
jgi:hypothetical protein